MTRAPPGRPHALEAIEPYPAEIDVHLDDFGRLELLDAALDGLEADLAEAPVDCTGCREGRATGTLSLGPPIFPRLRLR